MTESDALLAAIAADPDDDTPRLALADWLDEHGDPARAEFIRVQIEYARAAERDPRRVPLRERAAQLLAAHERTWLPPGPDRLALFYEWRRGFVTVLDPCARGVLGGEDSLKRLALFPLAEELEFGFCLDDEEFRYMPELPNLRAFGVGGNVRITAASVRQIGRWRALRRLRLNGDNITDEALPHLAGLSALEELDLGYSGVTDAGLRHLAPLAALRSLDVSDTHVTGTGLGVARHWPSLRRLRLDRTWLADGGLGELAACPALEELHFEDERWTQPLGDAFLAPIGHLSRLRALSLGGWVEPAATLNVLRRLPRLEDLRLVGPDFGDEGFAEVCRLPRLKRLHYSGGVLGAPALRALERAPGLVALELPRLGLADDALGCLAPLRDLRWLDLSGNPVGDRGLASIAALPELEALLLDGTQVSDRGLQIPVPFPNLRRFRCLGTAVTREGAWDRRGAWAPLLEDACGGELWGSRHWRIGSPAWVHQECSW